MPIWTKYREELNANLLPAVQAAALYHLDVIAGLLERPDRDCDDLTRIDFEDHLDEILALARRFAAGNQHLRTQANQAKLQGNNGPAQFLVVLRDIYAAGTSAQRALCGQRPMGWSALEELVAERDRLGATRLIPA